MIKLLVAIVALLFRVSDFVHAESGAASGLEMESDTSSVNVMSYNIRYDTPDDGINAWPHRIDHVAEMMGPKYQADIVGVQEALRHQLDDLQERLPGFAWVGVGRDDGEDGGEFVPIFYRTDRFELIESDTFWLSESPDVPGSRSWDAAITRIVTRARFRDREEDKEFFVFNTHFDHRGESAREESARILVDRVAGFMEETPVIITGDLNVRETSNAYSVFADAPGIHDARYVSETGHQGPTATFNNWVELLPEESRIDYIFVTEGIRVLTHRILDDRYGGRFPSDHLPVLAEMVLP